MGVSRGFEDARSVKVDCSTVVSHEGSTKDQTTR